MTGASATIIYLLRHGRDVNPRHLIKGHLPGFPLSEEGKREIENAARLLSEKKISAIYTSPLLRTRQSAKIFHEAFPQASFRVLKELTEWRTELQGKSRRIVEGKPYSFFQKYFEPGESVIERMKKAAKIIVRENPDASVVAFSHGGPIAILRMSLEGEEFRYPLKSLPYERVLVIRVNEKLNLLEPIETLRF